MKNLSLYIHIPFCVRKCYYCDFLSAPGSLQTQEQYFHGLIEEIQRVGIQYQSYQIQSIFIGGGTPSIFPPNWIQELIHTIKNQFKLYENGEITMEMNPGTIKRLEDFKILKECGINRLSIGLQSTKDEELKLLGRIHTFGEFLQSYELARQAGFSNINIDLMSALPSQGVDSYLETLHRVCRLKPEHISAYSLIIEEGTPFYDKVIVQKEEMGLPTEEIEREMYQLTEEVLASYGYKRYEISNYAKEGMECAHNLVYWTRGEYLGLGIGAASMIQNKRFKNTGSLEAYIQEKGAVPYEEIEELTIEEQMAEYMILGLRLTAGIREAEFTKLFGHPPEWYYKEILHKNVKDGLLLMQDGKIYLTSRGMDLSNYVMAAFI